MCLLQSWLKKVVEEEMNTTERARIVQAIRSGVPSVFIHMHKKAMVSLIMGDSPVTAEQCPETLLFDVYRLFLLNLDFKYLVLASTVLVTIANSLPQTSGDFKVCVCVVVVAFLVSRVLTLFFSG